METTTDQLIAEVEDGIGWLTFNHPERRNALTMAMTAGCPTSSSSSRPTMRCACWR